MIKIPLQTSTYSTSENRTKFFSRLRWGIGERTDEKWQDTNKPLVGDFNESLRTFELTVPVDFPHFLFNIFSFGIEASGEIVESNGWGEITVTYKLPMMSALKFFAIYCSPLLWIYQNVIEYFSDEAELNMGLIVIGAAVPILGLWLITSQTNSFEKKIIDLFGVENDN